MERTLEVEGTTYRVTSRAIPPFGPGFKFKFDFISDRGDPGPFFYSISVDPDALAGMGIMIQEDAERMAYVEATRHIREGRIRNTTIAIGPREITVGDGT